MCIPLNWYGWDVYRKGWAIADSLNPERHKEQIFRTDVLGFQTHRDDFAIAFEREVMKKRIDDLRDRHVTDEDIRERYKIKEGRRKKAKVQQAETGDDDENDTSAWNLADARASIQKKSAGEISNRLVECAYRPFDLRSCFYGTELMDRPRRELIDHVLNRSNLQLLVSRQIGTKDWRHVFVAADPANDCAISDGSSEANYCFPIHSFNSNSVLSENLSPEFRAFLNSRYAHQYTSEEILGYIYAVLHAPTYRARYAEFLRIDFPRIPFPESAEDFETLSHLGWALVEAHLLRNLPRRNLAAYHGKGDHAVEFVRYSEAAQSIAINETQRFAPVPKPVWDFHIGGYQVLDKYLKSARAGSCPSMKSTMWRRSRTRSPSPSTRWRGSTRPIAPLFREWG